MYQSIAENLVLTDLILKGIKTLLDSFKSLFKELLVLTDLILKEIKLHSKFILY